MSIILITSVKRHVPPNQASGFLYSFDLKKKNVIKRSTMIEAPYRRFDTNPPGGLRGARGIAFQDEMIAIANPSEIFLFDKRWDIQNIITHPSCSSIHDISFQHGMVWVCSAINDILACLDMNGNLVNYYYMGDIAPELKSVNWKPAKQLTRNGIQTGRIDFRDPRQFEAAIYDRAHVNSVCFLPDGSLLVSLGRLMTVWFKMLMKAKDRLYTKGIWRYILKINSDIRHLTKTPVQGQMDLIVQPARGKSAIFRIHKNSTPRLCLSIDQITVPSHSLVLLEDQTCLYLNTTTGEVLRFTPQSGELISCTKVTNGILRGACVLSNEIVVLGSTNMLLFFSVKETKIIDSVQIADATSESIYDIKLLPDYFQLPPDHLSDNLGDHTQIRESRFEGYI